MLPDFERADLIGEFWGYPKTRTFAELLIDCEEDTPGGTRWDARRGATGFLPVAGPTVSPRRRAVLTSP
jgi:hypothetical protein